MTTVRPNRSGLEAFCRAAIAVCLVAQLVPLGASAKEDFEWGVEAAITSEFDSNVFNLDSAGQDRVEDRAPVDEQNGRLRDMESVYDFIFSPAVEVMGAFETPLGRLAIAPRGEYHQYVLNVAKSYPEFGVELRQSLPKHSELWFDFDYELGVFKKNYLKDTIGTGHITDAERIYEPGDYDGLAVELGFERRIWRGGEDTNHPWLPRVSAALAGGYGQQRFAHGFSNRDLDVWSGRVSFDSRFAKPLEVLLAYEFAYAGAPGNDEVSILDEPSVGMDLNGDSDALDDDIRAFDTVDRSRYAHEIRVRLKSHLGHRLRLWADYRYGLRDFLSQAALDIGHRGRSDDIHKGEVGLTWGLHEHWAITLAGEVDGRTSNKSADLVDEEDGAKFGYAPRLTITSRF